MHPQKAVKGKRANETDQLSLLERDVKILFDEVRRLRTENDILLEQNENLRYRLENEEQAEKDDIAEYIRHQRLARKLSFDAFARMLGTTGPTLSNYEKSKGKLSNMKEIVKNIRTLRGK